MFETRDESFDDYNGYHAFWKRYGIGLPDEELQKVYYYVNECAQTAAGIAAVGIPARVMRASDFPRPSVRTSRMAGK